MVQWWCTGLPASSPTAALALPCEEPGPLEQFNQGAVIHVSSSFWSIHLASGLYLEWLMAKLTGVPLGAAVSDKDDISRTMEHEGDVRKETGWEMMTSAARHDGRWSVEPVAGAVMCTARSGRISGMT